MSKVLIIKYKPRFIRLYNNFESTQQEEIREKIGLFTSEANHTMLKVHKLQGKLKGRFSFSVNYKTRIVFVYESKQTVVLLVVGSHDVYN